MLNCFNEFIQLEALREMADASSFGQLVMASILMIVVAGNKGGNLTREKFPHLAGLSEP